MFIRSQRANVASIMSRCAELAGLVDLIKSPIRPYKRVNTHDNNWHISGSTKCHFVRIDRDPEWFVAPA